MITIIDQLQESQKLDDAKLRRLADCKSFRAAADAACLEYEAHGALSQKVCEDRYAAPSALEKLAALYAGGENWPPFDLKANRATICRGRVDELQNLAEFLGNERHVHWRRRMAPEFKAAYARITATLEADLRDAKVPTKLETKYGLAPEGSVLVRALENAIGGFRDELARLESSEIGFGKDLVYAHGPRVWVSRYFNEPL